jgi:hypothetical protein
MAFLANLLQTLELGATAWRTICNANFVLIDAFMGSSKNASQNFYHPGNLTTDDIIRRNNVMKYAGTVTGFSAHADMVPQSPCTIRLQVGTDVSPTNYVDLTIENGTFDGSITGGFSYAVGDELCFRCISGDGTAGQITFLIYLL